MSHESRGLKKCQKALFERPPNCLFIIVNKVNVSEIHLLVNTKLIKIGKKIGTIQNFLAKSCLFQDSTYYL